MDTGFNPFFEQLLHVVEKLLCCVHPFGYKPGTCFLAHVYPNPTPFEQAVGTNTNHQGNVDVQRGLIWKIIWYVLTQRCPNNQGSPKIMSSQWQFHFYRVTFQKKERSQCLSDPLLAWVDELGGSLVLFQPIMLVKWGSVRVWLVKHKLGQQ